MTQENFLDVPALLKSIRDGKLRPEYVIRCITDLSSPDPEARQSAAIALTSRAAEAREALPALRNAANDSDPRVRFYAARACHYIDPTHESGRQALIHEFRSTQDEDIRAEILDYCATLGPEAKSFLSEILDGLTAAEHSVRYSAICATGMIGPDAARAIPILIGLLADSSPRIRMEAANALGGIGASASGSIPYLVRALKDTDREVRFCAANAIGQFGPIAKHAAPALADALKDPDVEVRFNAARALAMVQTTDGAILPLLIEALAEDYPGTVYHAAMALGNLGKQASIALPALHTAYQRTKESDIREQLQREINRISETS